MCGSFVKNLVFNNWIKKKLKFKMLILYILFGKRRKLWDIWKCEYLKLLKSDYYICRFFSLYGLYNGMWRSIIYLDVELIYVFV